MTLPLLRPKRYACDPSNATLTGFLFFFLPLSSRWIKLGAVRRGAARERKEENWPPATPALCCDSRRAVFVIDPRPRKGWQLLKGNWNRGQFWDHCAGTAKISEASLLFLSARFVGPRPHCWPQGDKRFDGDTACLIVCK